MKKNIFTKIVHFYYEGFRSMTWGRTLWCVILVKLFIMFAILKVFFFPDFLKEHKGQDTEEDYVRNTLIQRADTVNLAK